MAFCASCGSPVEGRFCAKCGATVGVGAPPVSAGVPPAGAATPQPVAASAGMSDNAASALCYVLGFITGILFLVLEPYSKNKNVRFHAFQAIFFGVGTMVLWIVLIAVSAVLSHIPILGPLLSLLLMLVLWLGALIVWLMLMFKAYNNQRMVLPVIGPLAEKQS